jgi:hypothetical protein
VPRSRNDHGTLIGGEGSPATSDGLDPDPEDGTEPALEEGLEPAAHDDVAETDAVAPPKSRRRRLILRIGLGVGGAALVAGIVLAVLLRGGGSPIHTARSPTPSPVTVPARIPFQFSLNSVTTSSFTGRDAPKAARNAAEQIRVVLSDWYDAAFADPGEWKKGPAPAAWSAFSRSVIGGAKRDRQALSLGPVEGLTILEATGSKLNVRVLLDPSLKTLGAVAYVTFDAAGKLAGGDLLEVANTARFILRPVAGHWVIVAYPSARTTARQRPAPRPSPLAGPTASATA